MPWPLRLLMLVLPPAVLCCCGVKIDPALGGEDNPGALPAGLESWRVCYADHVAPILKERCVGCHNQGFTYKRGLALDDSATVRKHLDLIVTVTTNRVMPPRNLDMPETGRPATPLSGEARAILRAWRDNGARGCGDIP